jgi:CubicO group peptidase (beta-lactamase class C family)
MTRSESHTLQMIRPSPQNTAASLVKRFSAACGPRTRAGPGPNTCRPHRLARLLLTILVSSLLSAIPICRAQNLAPEMDRIAHDYLQRKQFTGVILVARDGKILFEKSYGAANLEWNIPNFVTTKFRIASLTKQFTAASIFILQDRGKLDVRDPVRKYLPDAPSVWDQVTIYNLLTHTSGIPNSFDGITSWRQSKTPEQLVAAFRNKPLDFTPGETRKYSNAGYYLLGYLIESISGQTYGDFVRENIFRPLGMNDSGPVSSSAIISNRASGYHLTASGVENAKFYDESLLFSAGGLYSTAEDLLHWEQALFGGKLLSVASFTQMTTPFKHDFACGLVVSVIDGHPAFEHSGEMDGFSSDMVYFPEDRLVVIVLNNLGGETKSIAAKLAAVVHGEKIILPSERREISVPPTLLRKYTGTYRDMIPGYDIAITLEAGHLVAQITDSDKHPLVAESDSAFFDKQSEAELEFLQNEKGEYTVVLYTQAGHKMKGLRK